MSVNFKLPYELNEVLLERCESDKPATIVKKRRWTWVGHVLHREPNSLLRIALHWTPEGKRKRGRPKTMWRRTMEGEIKKLGKTWGQLVCTVLYFERMPILRAPAKCTLSSSSNEWILLLTGHIVLEYIVHIWTISGYIHFDK